VTEEYKNIDQIIRQKFEAFQVTPPESVWNRIKSTLGGSGGSGGLSNSPITLPIIITSGILFLIIAFFLNQSFHDENLAFNPGDYSHKMLMAQSNETKLTNTSYQSEPQLKEFEVDGYAFRQEDSSVEIPSAFDKKPAESIKVRVPAFERKTQNVSSADQTATDSYEAKYTRAYISNLQLIRKTSNEISGNLRKNEKLDLRSTSGIPAWDDYRKERNDSWAIGAFFTPEVTFYNQDSLSNVSSYAFDINVFYQFSNYFIQTGLGWKHKKDQGNYHIDYNQFMGTFDDVYLVTFDSVGNTVVPTYHTNEVDVYDTVNHFMIRDTYLKYSYLEVPLLFGYRKNINKFSYFIKGGPNVSILISKQAEDVNDWYGQNQILNVDQKTPSRVSLNWQLIFSAGIGYQLSDQFTFTAEPTFRYHMNHEYENMNPSGNNPFSIGFRTGIIYHLNK